MAGQAVEANVRWSMQQILETPEGRERQAEGSVSSSARSTKSKRAVCGFSREPILHNQ